MKDLKLLVLLIIGLSGSLLSQVVRYVPSQYPTIQVAVDSSKSGDTIKVASGTYIENVEIKSKKVIITGEDNTIIDGNGKTAVKFLETDGVIKNLIIKNSDLGVYSDGTGTGFNLEIIRCNISGNAKGIESKYTNHVFIINSVISHNETGFHAFYYGGNGFISSSTFSDNTADINYEPGYGTVAELSVVNSILRGEIQGAPDNPLKLFYCNYDPAKLKNNVVVKDGCQTGNPLFINLNMGDYRLQSGSPCLNAGSPNPFYNDLDGSRNDLGYTGGCGILLANPQIEFGYLLNNSKNNIPLIIRNYSNNAIKLKGIDLADQMITSDVYLPLTLKPGENTTINVTLTPSTKGAFSKQIKIYSDDLKGAASAEFPVSAIVLNYSSGIIKVPSEAPTIQAALDVLKPGDTVMVSEGTFHENISFKGKIPVLMGSGIDKTIIDGDGNDAISTFSGDSRGGVIKDLTIKNSNAAVNFSGDYYNPTIKVIGCKLTSNNIGIQSSFHGHVYLINSLVIRNNTGFLQTYYGENAFVSNSTFFGNNIDLQYTPDYETTCELTAINSILRDQITGTSTNPVKLVNCNYDPSKLGTNVLHQEGNLTADPLFADTLNNDFRLRASSPCVNAGKTDTTGLQLPAEDLAGNYRIWYGRIDIGAYEYGAPVLNSVYPMVKIGNTSGSKNDSIHVPIYVKNLKDVGALTLKLSFNTEILTFGGAINLNDQASDALVNASNGIVTIAWDGLSGLNIQDGKLLDLKFYYKGADSSTPLNFLLPECEVTNLLAEPLMIDLVNGEVVQGVNVSGIVTYDNEVNTVLDNAKLDMIENNSVVSNSFTDNTGMYKFCGVETGDYNFGITTDKPWGGVNSTDALEIRKYIVGQSILSGLRLKAADINKSGGITSADALLIRRRFVKQITSFSLNDWLADSVSVSVANSDIVKNIKMICAGDVNASYEFVLSKQNTTIVNHKQFLNLKAKEVVPIPVYLDDETTLGAISLVLTYPKDQIEIKSVSSKAEGLLSTADNGEIRIAWDDLNGLTFKKGEALAIVNVELKKDLPAGNSISFEAGAETEFADQNGHVLNSVSMNIANIQPAVPTQFNLSQNYPNPFNPSTVIAYDLPEDGRVTLEVFNLLGEKVVTLVDEMKAAGTYKTEWNALHQNSGIYIYRLNVSGAQKHYSQIRKMLLIK
ncbi:MAG TPA: choice-of-anchor Q domain-containing protein [Ignavibacteriales bacterium]|nr:choice-of-anchor Q domain-containing protein [Ignavibacteriales bacterium]